MHVDAVVECSLAGTKERIRVRIQLIDARNDAHLWAENFDRDTGDILVFYSEAGVAIADQLRIRLTQPERNRLASSRPVVPEAYEAYLKGRELHWAKITEEGHLKSIEYYQRAVEKDPTYAPAYAGLARAYMFLRQLYEPKEMRPKALAAAAKAIELDPTLAEPHTWLAQLREDERDWAAAEAEHRRALELGPGQASPHLFYAQFLNLVSRHEEALAEIRRAEQLDPLSAFTATNVIHRLIALRRFDEALRQAEKSLELDPNLWLTHFYIGRTYSELGQLEDATAAWEKAASLPGSYHWPLGELIRAYMRLEKKDEALRTLARWETDAKRRKPHPPALPKMYAIVGKREEAMVMLQGAYRRGDLTARQLQDPEISSLRSDPRFQELLRRTGTSLPKKK
jgi:tetratricopeptide (TPR) repeat protein